ncbi:MAG TPA: hypothetical protein VFD43_10120, partial [Planctomycetota bacterium]|nr:hypothetical protein [Planctomycetota bacterium]
MARTLVVLLLLLLLGSARGQAAPGDCTPSWIPTFGELPGVDDTVFASIVFDDGLGGGPAPYAGGGFGSAIDSGDGFLARWGGCPTTPSPWTHLGYALAGVDGPPLLAGTGPLTAGSAGTLKLTHAAPSAFSVLFVSLS